MATRDSRIDDYIARSADFARPILNHLRKLVHAGCPEAVETIKWSMPHFDHHGILCSMAAFKNHCSFGFWKGRLLFGPGKAASQKDKEGMGQFGRITALSDLPSDKVLLGWIRKAAALNEAGVKQKLKQKLPARSRPKTGKEPAVPADLAAALLKNAKARATFEGFSPSHRKEYVEWITEAKREATRQRRLAATLKWLAEGKSRHWKYTRC
jgi:uncharacterized protein YdeI (YjbR/CyaY-like superfamily)